LLKSSQTQRSAAEMCLVQPTKGGFFQFFCGIVAVATIAACIIIGED
jgi:hypothetical protein